MSLKSKQVKALAVLLRQMSDGLAAGVPLSELVPMIARSSPSVRHCPKVIEALARAARGETSVGHALAEQEELSAAAILFADVESEAGLAGAFQLLADDWEDRQRWQGLLASGLAWPLVLALAMVGLLVLFMAFVAPALKEVFLSFGGDLPLPTRLLLELSEWGVVLWLPISALVATTGWYLYSRQKKVMRSDWFSRTVCAMRLVRPVVEGRFHVRLGRVFLMSAETRVPALAAMRFVSDSTLLSRFANEARQTARAMVEGNTPADAVRQHLPELGDLAIALDIANRSDNPTPILQRVLAGLEHDLRLRRAKLERAILLRAYVVVGSVVGFILISTYLPIFKLGTVV